MRKPVRRWTVSWRIRSRTRQSPMCDSDGDQKREGSPSNMMVDITNYVDCEPKALGVTELVYYPVLAQILEENETKEDIEAAIRRGYPRPDSQAYYQGRYFRVHQL